MPSQRLQDEARDRHQRAGVAGAHDDIGLAFLDQIDCQAHRGIALAAQRLGRRVVHGHDFLGVHHLDAIAQIRSGGQVRFDLFAAPDKNQPNIGLTPRECKRRRSGDREPVITAHAVDGQSDRHRAAGPRGAIQERGVPEPVYSSFFVATTFLPR